MRGGFRSAVGRATGAGPEPTGARRLVSRLITVALLVAVAVFLLRRFGVINW